MWIVYARTLCELERLLIPGAAHDIYEAEAVLNHKLIGPSRRVHYLVHWQGRRLPRTRGNRRNTCEAVYYSLSTSRLARVGRRHASVDEGDSKAVLLSQRTDKGYRNRLAGSGRPGPARASRISWDLDRSERVGPAVSRGLVVKVTQVSFSKPFSMASSIRGQDRELPSSFGT